MSARENAAPAREARTLAHALLDRAFSTARAANTLRNYTAALERWAEAGVVSARDATPESASRFVERRLADGLKPHSVALEIAALLAVLRHEVAGGRFEEIKRHAISLCAPTRSRRRELSANFMTVEQVGAYCAGTDEQTAFVVRLACYTGLRASELAALDWTDVDLERRTIEVRGGKTGARRVPLCGPAVALLGPRTKRRGLVFGGTSAKALCQRVWRGRSASGPEVTLTLCRHTRASWWVAAGVPIAKCAKWLGHSVFVCSHYYAGLTDAYDPDVERGGACG